MKFKRIFYFFCILSIFFNSSALAKPFEKTSGIGIFIGEVAGYGEHEIKSQEMKEFKDKLAELFFIEQGTGKLHIVGGLYDDNSAPSFGDIIKVENVIQDIHMDAIAYGPSFQKENANAKMIFYAERALGEDYFWNDEKIAAKRKMIGKPYHISQRLTNAAKTIGEEYGADYLFFCNLVEVDVQLKNSIFSVSMGEMNETPKKIKVESFFYLIDTKTGLVYEGHNFSDKTGEFLALLGGKLMTAENLLKCMFEVQSKRIVKGVCNEGQKVLAKGI